jgi:hypothetical protein
VILNIDGEIGTYPSYSKRVGNVVVNIDPEVFSNGEFGYTVYYTKHIGQSGFKTELETITYKVIRVKEYLL